MTIKERRIKKGLSVHELAEKIGVSDAFIRYIEYGEKNPSIKTAKRIAATLECTLDELFSDDSEAEANND